MASSIGSASAAIRVPMRKAIPLISFDPETGKCQPNDVALAWIGSLRGPLGVIATAGKNRTGKSYLINKGILGKDNGAAGFGVGNTVQPQTKGVWIFTETIECMGEDGRSMQAIVIDTEGIGAYDADATHDCKIFCLALLLSSNFVYNSTAKIDEDAISALSLVADISKTIRINAPPAREEGDDMTDGDGDMCMDYPEEEDLGQIFPPLTWCLRDFSLELTDKTGNKISANEYMEMTLEQQPKASEDKNRIRRLICKYFSHRKCIPFVRPVNDESLLKRLESLSLQDLRPEFVRTLQDFRKNLLKTTKPKRLFGKLVSGRMLAGLCRSYCEALNSGNAPVIRDSLAMLGEIQGRDGIDFGIAVWDQLCNGQGEQPVFDMSNTLPQWRQKATERFKEIVDSDENKIFEQRLMQRLETKEAEFQTRNLHRLKLWTDQLGRALDQGTSDMVHVREFKMHVDRVSSKNGLDTMPESVQMLWHQRVCDKIWTWWESQSKKDQQIVSQLQGLAATHAEEKDALQKTFADHVAVLQRDFAQKEQNMSLVLEEAECAKAEITHANEIAAQAWMRERQDLQQQVEEIKACMQASTDNYHELENQFVHLQSTQAEQLLEMDRAVQLQKMQLERAQESAKTWEDEAKQSEDLIKSLQDQLTDLEIIKSRLRRAEDENKNQVALHEELTRERDMHEARFAQEVLQIRNESQKIIETVRKSHQETKEQLLQSRQDCETVENQRRIDTQNSKNVMDSTLSKLEQAKTEFLAMQKSYESQLEHCKAESANLRDETRKMQQSLENMQLQHEETLKTMRAQWREDVKMASERETDLMKQHMTKQMDLNQKVQSAQIQCARAEAQVEEYKTRLEDLQQRNADKRTRFDFESVNIRATQVEKENEHLKSMQRLADEKLQKVTVAKRDLERQLKETEHKLKLEQARLL